VIFHRAFRHWHAVLDDNDDSPPADGMQQQALKIRALAAPFTRRGCFLFGRLAMRDLDDVFRGLAGSRFRRQFRLQPRDAAYLRDKGIDVVMQHADEFVAQRLAPAQPANDGKQTPWRGHPVFVAQHATACCCRGCLEKWHAIPRGHELTDEERTHVRRALGRWLLAQLREGGP
jgi:hypothetical protein